jgi:hypothetical protein
VRETGNHSTSFSSLLDDRLRSFSKRSQGGKAKKGRKLRHFSQFSFGRTELGTHFA